MRLNPLVDLNYLDCRPIQQMEHFLSFNHDEDDVCSQFVLKKEEECTSESESLLQSISDKVTQKSKRIIKRQKARCRNQKKEVAEVSQEKEKRFQLPDDFESLGPQMKKKLQQKIKNRISAQNSRDKQREYIRQLEQQNRLLQTRNNELQDQDTCQSDSLSLKQQDKQPSLNIRLTVLLFVMLALLTTMPGIRQGDHKHLLNSHLAEPYLASFYKMLAESGHI